MSSDPADDFKSLPPKPKYIEEGTAPTPKELGLKPVFHPDTGRTVDLPPLSLIQADQDALAANNYKIGSPWMTGGFGVIYAATQGTGHEVKKFAAKVVDLDGLPSTYPKEVGKWKEFRHAHINQAKEILVLKEPARLLVIMELCDHDIQELVYHYTGWVPKKLAAAYYYQLNRGLSYMHSRGIAHYDIKPRNLLVSKARGNELRISDCCMSRVAYAAHHKKSSLASYAEWHDTFSYQAPQVCPTCGHVQDTATGGRCPMAADMFSVGCVLFFMLYKTRPFQSATMDPDELAEKQKKKQLSLRKRIEPPEDKGEGDIEGALEVMARHWNEDVSKRPTASMVIKEFATHYGKWANWTPTAAPGQWHFPN